MKDVFVINVRVELVTCRGWSESRGLKGRPVALADPFLTRRGTAACL